MSLVDRGSHSRKIFDGVPDSFEVARYHSLYGAREEMPDVLRPTAETADGVVSFFFVQICSDKSLWFWFRLGF